MDIITLLLFASLEIYANQFCLLGDHELDLPPPEIYYTSCRQVIKVSILHGVDPDISWGVAYKESRFVPELVSKKGARGLMQATSMWCRNREANGCHWVAAGLNALVRNRYKCIKYSARNRCLRRKDIGWRKALCYYACGKKCYKKGLDYADEVLEIRKKYKEGNFL